MKYRVPGSRATIFALVMLAMAAAVSRTHGEGGAWERASLTHRVGRVTMNLPRNGSLGICLYGDECLGIRWPGPEGVEFLGSGGVFLRFVKDGETAYTSVNPSSFKVLAGGSGKHKLFECCEGGKRYPNCGSDDDGDGNEDEDAFDGIDNDGDGLVDEDFAAIGNEMFVARAGEPTVGLVLSQSSYGWAYGHVRDFIGFTTVIEYSGDAKGSGRALLNLDAALYIDLEIGDPEDALRGNDDRFFLFRGLQKGFSEDCDLEFAAADDGDGGCDLAAILILDAEAPDGSSLGVEGLIVDAVAEADSL
ncbi:MAG: hypothetical protein KAX38_07110, partial [Candidatus Krumholzibacteria bacterium]|nr:hypothetical protein [Candidatus Krumholzibacteria bacterium]